MWFFFEQIVYKYLAALEEKKENGFFVIKSNRLKTQIISFIIVVIAFVIVGFLFDTLNSIHYMFYLALGSINASYFVSLYFENKEYKIRHELEFSVFNALSRDVILFLNGTLMIGLFLINVVYSPFFTLWDQIILLLPSIFTSLVLLVRVFGDDKFKSGLLSNVLMGILVSLLYVFLLYTIPFTNNVISIIVPTVIVLVLVLLKYNILPDYVVFADKKHVVSIIYSIIVMGGLVVSVMMTYSNGSNGYEFGEFYTFKLNDDMICDTGVNDYHPYTLFTNDYVFIYSGREIKAMDYNCNQIGSVPVAYPFEVYEVDGVVSVLSFTEVDEELLEDYKAYTLYHFEDNSFVEDRIVYQMGRSPSMLFMYDGDLVSRVQGCYSVSGSSCIPHIQIYDDTSNYGVMEKTVEDVIYYQDDNDLIYQSNMSTLQSNPDSGSSFLYSDGYVLHFSLYSDEEGIIQIDTVQAMLDNSNYSDPGIQIKKDELNSTYNIAQSFYYVDETFYIQSSNTLYMFNQKGRKINTIENIDEFSVQGDKLIVFKDEDTWVLQTVDISNPGSFILRSHRYINEDDGYSFRAIDWELYTVHAHKLYVNFIVIALLVVGFTINIKYLERKV